MTTEVTELHRAALRDAALVISGIRGWDAPSRCAGWSRRELLGHMIGQNHGFARAIRDGDAPAQAFAAVDDEDWTSSVVELEAALATPCDPLTLVEVRREPLPLAVALGMQMLDLVVHAWDLAGNAYRPGEELADAVARAARMVPDERPAGGAFAAALPAPEGEDDVWFATLRLLGRDPSDGRVAS